MILGNYQHYQKTIDKLAQKNKLKYILNNVEKLKDEFGIDIKQYTFGIITSKNGYDYNINKIYTGEDENKINDIFYSFEDNDETEKNV